MLSVLPGQVATGIRKPTLLNLSLSQENSTLFAAAQSVFDLFCSGETLSLRN